MAARKGDACLTVIHMEFSGRGAATVIDRRSVAFEGSEAAMNSSTYCFWQGLRLAIGGRRDVQFLYIFHLGHVLSLLHVRRLCV